jgi:hypothetical protein
MTASRAGWRSRSNGLVGNQFSQPIDVRPRRDHDGVPLDRPPRPPAGELTERVRRAILAAARRLNLDASELLDRHAQAEALADVHDVVNDVEERYGLDPKSLLNDPETQLRLGRIQVGRGVLSSAARTALYAERVLYALPDAEFLTVIEHAVADDAPGCVMGDEELADAAGEILEAHGCAFRREPANWPHFEWVGDPKQHELVIEPALRALHDERLNGPRAEFEEALRKRRVGAPKDLEDAVDEAAKSVESILKVLHDEHGVTHPRSQHLTALFNSLVAAPLLPGYVDKLVAGAAGARNHMASHGQGGTVREVPEELADASIAAAATAITFLAYYLP